MTTEIIYIIHILYLAAGFHTLLGRTPTKRRSRATRWPRRRATGPSRQARPRPSPGYCATLAAATQMMEPDTEHWSWSIFRTWQLALVFLLPSTLFFAASIATAVRLHSRGMLFTGSRWLPQAIDVRRLLADGLYVDTQRVRTAKEMIAAHRATPARIASNFLARSRPLGPHTAITEADVRAAYSPHATLPDGEELLADGVVLLLRLACLLVASGQATVEIELLLASICQRLSLRGAVVQVGHREVRAQFGGGEPVFYASCGMDFKLSRMSDVQMLARRVALVKRLREIPHCWWILALGRCAPPRTARRGVSGHVGCLDESRVGRSRSRLSREHYLPSITCYIFPPTYNQQSRGRSRLVPLTLGAHTARQDKIPRNTAAAPVIASGCFCH